MNSGINEKSTIHKNDRLELVQLDYEYDESTDTLSIHRLPILAWAIREDGRKSDWGYFTCVPITAAGFSRPGDLEMPLMQDINTGLWYPDYSGSWCADQEELREEILFRVKAKTRREEYLKEEAIA